MQERSRDLATVVVLCTYLAVVFVLHCSVLRVPSLPPRAFHTTYLQPPNHLRSNDAELRNLPGMTSKINSEAQSLR